MSRPLRRRRSWAWRYSLGTWACAANSRPAWPAGQRPGIRKLTAVRDGSEPRSSSGVGPSRDGEHGGGEGMLTVSSSPGTWAAAAVGHSPARSWCGNALAAGPGGACVADEVAELVAARDAEPGVGAV